MFNPILLHHILGILHLPFPNLDCFASSMNTLCPSYISYHINGEAIAQNFFTCNLNWSFFTVWANPPYSPNTLLKTVSSFIKRHLTGYLLMLSKPNESYH